MDRTGLEAVEVEVVVSVEGLGLGDGGVECGLGDLEVLAVGGLVAQADALVLAPLRDRLDVILIIEVGQALAPVVYDLLGVLVEGELAYGLAHIGYAGALANIIINWLEEGCATPRDQVSEAMISIIFPTTGTLERLRGGVPVALT